MASGSWSTHEEEEEEEEEEELERSWRSLVLKNKIPSAHKRSRRSQKNKTLPAHKRPRRSLNTEPSPAPEVSRRYETLPAPEISRRSLNNEILPAPERSRRTLHSETTFNGTTEDETSADLLYNETFNGTTEDGTSADLLHNETMFNGTTEDGQSDDLSVEDGGQQMEGTEEDLPVVMTYRIILPNDEEINDATKRSDTIIVSRNCICIYGVYSYSNISCVHTLYVLPKRNTT